MVETVMNSVAVFARMRSQQKGQVMDLLGTRGFFQNVEGQQHHIPVSVWQSGTMVPALALDAAYIRQDNACTCLACSLTWHTSQHLAVRQNNACACLACSLHRIPVSIWQSDSTMPALVMHAAVHHVPVKKASGSQTAWRIQLPCMQHSAEIK